jgi:hypothetical protein
LGAIIITLLYMVPIVGLITWMLLGLWGLGSQLVLLSVVEARIAAEKNSARSHRFPSWVQPVRTHQEIGHNPVRAFASGLGHAGTNMPLLQTIGTPPQTRVIRPDPTARHARDLALPRAGFWERIRRVSSRSRARDYSICACGGMPLGLLVALAYFTAMWTWKGTTIGGIVLGLKVVRVDGQPLPGM